MPNFTDTYIRIDVFSVLPDDLHKVQSVSTSSHFDHHIISSTEIITLKCYLPSSLHVCLLGTWNNPPLEIILARPRESSPLSKSLRQCLCLSVSPNANQDVMFGWYGKKTA